MKRVLTLISLIAPCLVLGLGAAGSCGKARPMSSAQAKAVVAGINAGVDEFVRAIPDLGLPESEARVLSAAFEEARLSGPLAERAANFDSLSRAGRARLAADVADHLSAAAARLSDNGIGVKSEEGRQKLSEYRRRIRLATVGLRIYAAAVEAGTVPDATPSPTPVIVTLDPVPTLTDHVKFPAPTPSPSPR